MKSAPVDTVTVGRERMSERFEAGGAVRATTTAEIVSRIMAPVMELRVRPGARVAAGAPLVVLDSRQPDEERRRAEAAQEAARHAAPVAKAHMARAEAELNVTSQTYERVAALRRKNSSTPQELDRAKADLDAATAEVQAARGAIDQAAAALEAASAGVSAASVAASYAVLRAPFAGLVTETRIDPGSMATPGTTLLVLEDPRRYRLEVRLDESRAQTVRVGDAVQVRLGRDAAATTLDGRVDEVARLLDAAHTVTVRIGLPPNPALRSGSYGAASFEGGSRETVVVPASTVLRRGQLAMVFVVEGGRARLRLVQPGAAGGDRIEILAGVDVGETVVVRPPAGLVDGAPVDGASTPGARGAAQGARGPQ